MSNANPIVFDVTGMDCGDCARTIERVAAATSGVDAAVVNFAVGTLTVTPTSTAITELPTSIAHNIDRAGYQAHLRRAGDLPRRIPWYRHESTRRAGLGVVFWLIAAATHLWLDSDGITTSLYLLAIFFGGIHIARSAWLAIRVRRIDMNVLMTVSVIGAAAIGEWAEGALVVVLFSIGSALQELTFNRTRNSIRSLFELAPEEATLVHAGQEMRVRAESLAIGDIVRIRPGERVPVDGDIITGQSAFNQSAITGESMPIEKSAGEQVYAGTLNGSGVVDIRVTALPQDSTIATVIRLVEEATATRAPSQQMVDRFAEIYTPAVIVIAAGLSVIGWVAGDFDTWFYRALVLLVIACPCALVISTPVSIVSAIGQATRLGVLVKGGAALEEAGHIDTVVFDKTGTLTIGKPVVTGIQPAAGIAESELVALAAAVETNSEHPLARAIVAHATRANLPIATATSFEAITSAGAMATIDGRHIGVGNHRLMARLGIAETELAQLSHDDAGVIFVGEPGQLLGAIRIADRERESARGVVRDLRDAGIRTITMLTGDRTSVATHIGEIVGINDVRTELLPQDKSTAVTVMRSNGGRVMMIGDGINDAPALALANVGIAMGMGGTDIALESADMALMRDDLTVLPRIIRLSRRTVDIIRQNITLSLVTKLLALGLGVFGFVSLWIAVVVDVGTSLIVTLNGMRLGRDLD